MGTYTHAHPGLAGIRHRPYAAGALAGLIAGIVMIVISMIVAAGTGAGATMPLRLIAAALFGVDALVGGMGILLVGLIMHLAFSAVAGVVFAGIVGNVRTGVAFGAGIVYGIIIWAVNTLGILPATDPTMSARSALMPGWWFVFHLIYGGMLFLVPVLHRAPTVLHRAPTGER
jgi:uncharacterized membrane protein YagU involved in acid resistance